jgi:hypothetical protein
MIMDIPANHTEAIERIQEWVRQADDVMKDLVAATVPVVNVKFSTKEEWIIGSLGTACLRVTGSIFLLLESGREWDAAILDRSLIEGTLKFLFLLSDEGQFKSRMKDYSETQFEISQVKDHNKAKEFVECLRAMSAQIPKNVAGMLLEPGVLAELLEKYPRKIRQQADARWGVAKLIEYLTSSQLPVADLFPTLLHPYAMSSHVVHMDSIGVEVMSERMIRTQDRSLTVLMSHAAGLLYNACIFHIMRGMLLASFLGVKSTGLLEAFGAHQVFFDSLSDFQESWESLEYPESS